MPRKETKVVMRHQLSGLRNRKPWPKPGETASVSEREAERLIRQGHAVKPEDAKKSESA